jgi:hypothetical protein
MPSLFKYFAFVGAALFGLLSLANFLLDPSTGATTVASAPAKPVAVQHDPRASKIERWRDEQAALKAAEQTRTSESAPLATRSTPEPYRPVPASTAGTAAPQPTAPAKAAESEPATAQLAAAPTTPTSETASIVGVETAEEAAAARAKVAERKAKVAKAKAKKERLARERALSGQQVAGYGGVPVAGYFGAPRERTAANQQDQYYYGQRGGSQQLTTRYSSAYAPQQGYGPFGRGW